MTDAMENITLLCILLFSVSGIRKIGEGKPSEDGARIAHQTTSTGHHSKLCEAHGGPQLAQNSVLAWCEARTTEKQS